MEGLFNTPVTTLKKDLSFNDSHEIPIFPTALIYFLQLQDVMSSLIPNFKPFLLQKYLRYFDLVIESYYMKEKEA